jgi:hypothetical protein
VMAGTTFGTVPGTYYVLTNVDYFISQLRPS